MRISIIAFAIMLFCVPTFVGAQSSMQGWVDSLGDAPNAGPCSKLITQMSRARQAHAQGVLDDDIRNKVLQDDPYKQADTAIAVIHMPGKFSENAYHEQIKCEKKYKMGIYANQP